MGSPRAEMEEAGGRVPKLAPGGDCLTSLSWVAVVVSVEVCTCT